MGDVTKRHKRQFYFLLHPVRLYLRLKFNFKRPSKPEIDDPYILISNHVTNVDMLFAGVTMRRHMYFVASEHTMRAGFASKVLKYVFDPIIREKATVAISTVLQMRRTLKAGNNICLFAEGVRCPSGRSVGAVPSTAAVVRRLGVKLVTFRIHGGYLSSPRWSHTTRRGKITCEVVNVYTPEKLKAMTDEELAEAINRDIYVDAYEENEREHIAYKGKKLAEGIESELVMCPKCGEMNCLQSRDNSFSCSCGLHGTYDEYGKLHGEGFKFSTVAEWEDWERAEISALPDCPQEQLLCRNADQILLKIGEDHTSQIAARGELSLTSTQLSVGDFSIPLDKISKYDIIQPGYLLFSANDGSYYEIKNPKQRFPGFLYQLLLDRYGKKTVQESEK